MTTTASRHTRPRGARRAAIVTVITGIATLWAPATVAAAATSPASINVPRDFPAIQAAVNAAPAGATIHIAPGTYTEQLIVNKDLDLLGAGAAATTIKSPSTLTPFAVNTLTNSPITAIVRVGHGAHVHISGLTVSGPIPCDPIAGVAVVQAATLDLSDATVRDITHDAGCPETARSVTFGLPPYFLVEGVPGGATASGRVSHVLIDTYQDVALQAIGPRSAVPTSVTFSDNVIISRNLPIPTDQLSIFLAGRNLTARVTGNTVTGGSCDIPGCGPDPINENQAAGILAGGIGAGTTISDNHITGSDVGIYQLNSPNCCTITDNTLTDNRFFGIVIKTVTAAPTPTRSAAARSASASSRTPSTRQAPSAATSSPAPAWHPCARSNAADSPRPRRSYPRKASTTFGSSAIAAGR
jgi:parallel beta-helix repeat protein